MSKKKKPLQKRIEALFEERGYTVGQDLTEDKVVTMVAHVLNATDRAQADLQQARKLCLIVSAGA